MSTSIEALTRGLPVEFAKYFTYVKALKFDDRPDYAYLKQLFADLYVREGFESNGAFDWQSMPGGAGSTITGTTSGNDLAGNNMGSVPVLPGGADKRISSTRRLDDTNARLFTTAPALGGEDLPPAPGRRRPGFFARLFGGMCAPSSSKVPTD